MMTGKIALICVFLYCLIISPTLQLDIDNCINDIGLESGTLPDTSISASSSYDPLNVGPQHSRLGQDTAGGAWCPSAPVGPEPESHQEWLGVNLTSAHVISTILTQGRYAQGQGQEYTMAYRIMYWRPGMSRFKEYRDSVGRNILLGNSDTFNVATNVLNPPLIASAIRILPYSNHSRTVCLRLGLIGCPFQENLISYNVPQGMVRGATLELLDITYDGLEDPITGYLTGGLGQLVDGKYGAENYRAVGENGLVRGYEWVGWKNKSMGPLQMDFTFSDVRRFDQVLIHINNHYSKDIQIFSRAKIYFSNEEGKFGDDRAVDYIYMPDKMVEDARNVSINLHGEHGKYVMMQLFFADKWMLISEVTFISSKYEEEKTPIIPEEKFLDLDLALDRKLDKINAPEIELETRASTRHVFTTEPPSTVEYSAVQTEAPHQSYGSSHAGLIIGILLTIISLLIGAILYVVYQARLRSDKNTPTHHSACITDKIHRKLAASLDFEDFTSTYRAKMKVYGQVSALDDESSNNVYNTGTGSGHVYNTGTGSRHVPPSHVAAQYGLSDDVSDCDYAEPHAVLPLGHHHSPGQDQIYQAINVPPVISHSSLSSPSSLDLGHSRGLYGSYQKPTYQKIKKSRKYRSSSQNIYQSVTNCQSQIPTYDHGSSKFEPQVGHYEPPTFKYESKNSIYTTNRIPSLPPSANLELNVVRKSQLKIVERLGAGRFGEAHLCYFIGNQSSALVLVKSLETSCSFEKRREFQDEARVMSLAMDPNIAQVLGVNLDKDPWYMVQEFSEQGDLTQFLQNHVAESSASKMSDIPTLSYGALMYMASQIASGMKCLESFNFVHKDLATRNCQVYGGYQIKISDTGSLRSTYSSDYYHQLPIRWMAWEAVIKGEFGSKSDVWSFGVTLWEILTFAREQPYEQLTDKEVVENLNNLIENDSLCEFLHQPFNCPRDVYELMLECWSKHTEDRPDFQEIYLFLMRKNLGFDPNDE